MQLLGAGFVLPVGVDGLKINPEYTNSVTRPAPTPWAPADVGYYQRFDLRASYPLILTRAQALTVQGTYEWAQEHLVPIGFDTDLYDDQYNVARLQLEDHLRLPYGVLAATVIFSQGLGGRGETQAVLTGIPLSQQGASPTFSKLGLDATWTQPLPYDFQGALIAQAQTSFGHPLFIAEQFSLDGSQGASAYPLGTFSVDEGATLRGEIQRPFAVGWTEGRATIAPYIFAAAAGGSIDEPTAVQQGWISAQSFGIGVRLGADAARRSAARRDAQRRTGARVVQRARRGAGLSRQCRLRREILRAPCRGSSRVRRCRSREAGSGLPVSRRLAFWAAAMALRLPSPPARPRPSCRRTASSRPARPRSSSPAPICR